MKKTLAYILTACSCAAAYAQQTGHMYHTFVDSSRGNRNIPAEIWYPAAVSGTNVPLDTGVFPLLVFGHGFVMDVTAYENFRDRLVPERYILVFPSTETGFAPSHSDFGEDLAFLV